MDRCELFNFNYNLLLITSNLQQLEKEPNLASTTLVDPPIKVPSAVTMNPAPNETHASSTPQSPTTPAEDLVEAHLSHLLNLEVVGVLMGEPWVLMAARIEIEMGKIPGWKLAEQVQEKLAQFTSENIQQYWQRWNELTLAHPEAQPICSYLETMLEDKEDKMDHHLDRMRRIMTNCRQIGNHSKADAISNNIALINKALGRL